MVDQIAVVTLTTPSGAGTLDFTHPSITEAFTAAIFIYSGFSADDTDNVHGIIGMGFVAPDDGTTTAEQGMGACAENGGTGVVPDTGTRQSIADCIDVPDPTNVALAATVLAQYSASIAGGVRVNFSASIPIKVTAILFAGLARGYVTGLGSSTASAHEPIGGTIDFEPHLVIAIPSNGSLNTNNNDASVGLGFALNQGGLPQVCAYVDSDDATEPTDADGWISTANFVASITAARAARSAQITSFDSTGFNHIATALGTNSHVLALRFSGAFRLAVANMAVSAATGLQAFNAFGFTPDLCLGMSTLLTSLDTLTDGATAASSGYFVTGRYASRAYTWHHEEGLSGTGVWNAHSRQEDVAVLTYDDTGAVAHRATWAGGSGSGGFLLNFSTAAAAGYLTALGIQLIPSPEFGSQRPDYRVSGVRRARQRVAAAGRRAGSGLGRVLGIIARFRRAALFRQRFRPLPEFKPPAAGVPVDAALQAGDNAMAGSQRGSNAAPGSEQGS